ncbi:hypothetical protein AAMO2058_000492700 [Amorphochlora amoebiformis]
MGGTCSSRGLPKNSITFEDIASFPRRAEMGRQGCPTAISFSPDDKYVTFLQSEHGLSQRLYSMKIDTGDVELVVTEKELGISELLNGEEELSAEEKLRRERTRQLATGITSYSWASNADILLIPFKNDLYIKHGIEGKLVKAVESKSLPGSVMDPKVTSDGKIIIFVCNSEVYMCATDGSSAPVQVTSGARGNGLTNGIADYVAQEEMDRYDGFWVNPSGTLLAFEQVDERHIPKYRIMHQGSNEVPPKAQEDHAYPFAGAENPKVKLGIKTMQSGTEARVYWMDDDKLAYLVENRAQTSIQFHCYNLKTKSTSLLLSEERKEYWVNLHNIFIPLKTRPGFIWASESTGFQHLYVVGEKKKGEGKRENEFGGRALTTGKWVVDYCDASMVDEKNGYVYFLGAKAGIRSRQLFRVSLHPKGAIGPPISRVTREAGTHSVVMSRTMGMYVDTYSSSNAPFKVVIKSFKQGVIREVFESRNVRLQELKLQSPTFMYIPTKDNPHIRMCCATYQPNEEIFGKGPFPTIVSVYGGPHYQAVQDAWPITADLRAQHFAQNGYLVVKVDNRGSSRRGLAFEGALKHDMGSVEVEDQVTALAFLIERGLADPQKVGIYGWSYGGYMSLMCLAKYPDMFQAAVSGAPVTHWDGYDTHYTERYMGTPASNPSGYKSSSIMQYAKNITGKLMLVHGLIDENVHFRHTARLINTLIRHRIDYRLMLFPDERHQPRKVEDRVYMEQKIFEHFETAFSK